MLRAGIRTLNLSKMILFQVSDSVIMISNVDRTFPGHQALLNCLICRNPTFTATSWGKYCYYPQCTDKKPELQRGWVTCPRVQTRAGKIGIWTWEICQHPYLWQLCFSPSRQAKGIATYIFLLLEKLLYLLKNIAFLFILFPTEFAPKQNFLQAHLIWHQVFYWSNIYFY